jgi:hypothetical protein
LNLKSARHDQGRVLVVRGGPFLGEIIAMQSVRPDNTDPIPLRQSSQGVGTIMLRFVGLLAAAVVVMALIWSR